MYRGQRIKKLPLSVADQMKMLRKEGRPHEFLYGKALALVFEKASTRTRISFEVGMSELGGHALFLNPQDLQIGRGEEIAGAAAVRSAKHGEGHQGLLCRTAR